MWRTNWYQTWTTIPGQQEVRHFFPCWVNYSSLVWFGVAPDRWASHWSILVLPRVFQAIEQQAFLRVIALSRIDLSRGRFLVLLRLFALHHWPLTTVVAFLDLRRVSISSELESFLLSMCIDAPQSTTNSRSSGDVEVGAPCCSAGASFLVQGVVLCPVLNSGSARIAPVRFALLNDASRWTLSFPIFLCGATCHGEFDGVI